MGKTDNVKLICSNWAGKKAPLSILRTRRDIICYPIDPIKTHMSLVGFLSRIKRTIR